MEQYALYLVIKEIIDNLGYNFKTSFNDYDINGDNVIGIIFKGGTNPQYRELSTGKYYGYTNRVQLIIQSGYTKASLLNTLSILKNIRDILTSGIINKVYRAGSMRNSGGRLFINDNSGNDNSGNEVYVWITRTHLIGDVEFKSKSSQTRSIYSINMMFEYFIKLDTDGGN